MCVRDSRGVVEERCNCVVPNETGICEIPQKEHIPPGPPLLRRAIATKPATISKSAVVETLESYGGNLAPGMV
jgi:hypothetical protein